jgi:flagellin
MITIGSNSSSLQVSNLLTSITDRIDHKANVISSGKRIQSAADDPAGIAIAANIRSDKNSYATVEKNISSGTSLLDVSNSALSSVTDILGEMKNLALESKNETLSVDQRNALQSTFAELQKQYEETVNGAELFGQNLLKNAATDITLQTGIGAGAANETTIVAADTSAATLGIDAGTINVSSTANSDAAITAIDTALTSIGTNQAIMGSQSRGLQTRLDAVKDLGENLTSALSRVEDADIAKETSEFNLLQTQQQMAMQSLSIVNSFPQNALALMR